MSAHLVYFAHDSEGRLLYVGCTNNLPKRLREHRRLSVWFPHHASITTEGPFPKEDAFATEAHAIATQHPIFNTTAAEQGELNRRRGVMNRYRRQHGWDWASRDAVHRRAWAAADAEFPCAPTKDYLLARYLNDTGRWAA